MIIGAEKCELNGLSALIYDLQRAYNANFFHYKKALDNSDIVTV